MLPTQTSYRISLGPTLSSTMQNQHTEDAAPNNTEEAVGATGPRANQPDSEWQQEWRREDELDKERNLGILNRVLAETDPKRKWLGFMGFAKEEEARLSRKSSYLKQEEQHVWNKGLEKEDSL